MTNAMTPERTIQYFWAVIPSLQKKKTEKREGERKTKEI